ncbi:MAG: tetratricopeptide repeat protein [Candidatus Sericytochromatia bacterium]
MRSGWVLGLALWLTVNLWGWRAQAQSDPYYAEGLYLLQQQQFDRAAERLEQSTRLQARGDNLFALGVAYFRLHRYAQAHAAYTQALRQVPDEALSARIRSGLGDVLLQLEDYAPAVELYQRALAQEPTWAGVRLRLATAYLRLGRVDEALNEAETLRQYPNSTQEAAFLRSLIYLAQEQWEPASAELEQLSQDPVYRFQAWQQLNWLYRLQGRTDDAARTARLLVKYYGLAGPQAYQLAAGTWLERVRDCVGTRGCEPTQLAAEARDFFQRWLLLAPQQSQAYDGLGQLEQWLARWPEAKTAYAQAHRLFPERAVYVLHLALMERALGQSAEAKRRLQELPLPQDPQLWPELALWGIDQPELFVRWSTALPRQTDAQRGLALFWHTYIDWQRDGNWTPERELSWQRAERLLRSGAEVQVIQALRLWRAGQPEWALSLLRQTHAHSREFWLPLEMLARVQSRHQPEKATVWLNAAYRTMPHSLFLAETLLQLSESETARREHVRRILQTFPQNTHFQAAYLEMMGIHSDD